MCEDLDWTENEKTLHRGVTGRVNDVQRYLFINYEMTRSLCFSLDRVVFQYCRRLEIFSFSLRQLQRKGGVQAFGLTDHVNAEENGDAERC